MVTLFYRLTKRPQSIEDCMHLSRTIRPDSLRVDLAAEDFISEYDQVIHLCAHVTWSFQGKVVICRSTLALMRPDDSPEGKARALRIANNRLATMLAKLEAIDVEVLNASARFNDELLGRRSCRLGCWSVLGFECTKDNRDGSCTREEQQWPR